MAVKEGILKFLKKWMLIIAMVSGAGIYLLYHSIPQIHHYGPMLESICSTVQPVLLFLMLMLSFCKIEPGDLKPEKWHVWLLILQGGLFVSLSLLIIWAMKNGDGNSLSAFVMKYRIAFESALLCLICPTATACAVVTGKLGGNMASVVTYTVFINILVAIVVPLFVPLLYPMGGMSFGEAFVKILKKVFPLLIMPCITAWFIRYFLPRTHAWLLRRVHFAFYIWTISLTLAILMSTRAVIMNENSLPTLIQIAAVSFVCCMFQFGAGKLIGSPYGHRISAGQALGQKNTVFEIWMGYTFMDPVTSVAGGFYSIWHNCFNTWQLNRMQYRDKRIQE